MADRRDPYAAVATRQRHARDRALAAGASMRQLSVLAAVDYWVGSWSRFAASISTARIATKAGIWKRTEDTCPEWAARRASEDLRWLDDIAGAIEYRPGGQKDGPRVGRITYRPLSSTAQGSDPTTPEQHSSGVHDDDPRANQLATPEQSSSRPLSKSARERALTPELLSSPKRGSSEDSSEEGCRGPRARASLAGRAAARLASCTPAAMPDAEALAEARPLVEMLAWDGIDLEALIRALDDCDRLDRPHAIVSDFVSGWIAAEDEETGDRIASIAARFPVAHPIATAASIVSSDPWLSHLRESYRVAEWAWRYEVPSDVMRDVLDTVAADGLSHPGEAADKIQTRCAERGLEIPKFARAKPQKASNR